MVEIRLSKTYDVATKEEFEAILMQIIIGKVREITGDKPIRIKFKGDKYEWRNL